MMYTLTRFLAQAPGSKRRNVEDQNVENCFCHINNGRKTMTLGSCYTTFDANLCRNIF